MKHPTLIRGDCFEELPKLEANSAHSFVCDPPYGIRFMGKAWDGADIAKRTDERRQFSVDPDPKSGTTGGHRSVAAEAGKYRRDITAARAFQEFSRLWALESFRVLRPGGYLVAFASTRTYHRMVCGIEEAGFEIRDQLGWMFGSGFPKSKNVHGRGTALKPAWEPIVLARKPIEGNVEENFAKWGTGMLSIDECRIPFESPADQLEAMAKNRHEDFGSGSRQTHGIYGEEKRDRKNYIAAGRWPPNIMHDGSAEAAEILGSSQRFFYCAKASAADRDAGLEWEQLRPMARSNGAQSALSDDESYSGGSTDIGLNKVQMRANSHPTVKPTSLMRWLVRLVTPAGGRVVDPMMGSGSTGRACQLEDFEFFGIELEVDYFNFARRRVDEATGELFARQG
jgi:site-specific DNA-methyltransferase (adenine-specific)